MQPYDPQEHVGVAPTPVPHFGMADHGNGYANQHFHFPFFLVVLFIIFFATKLSAAYIKSSLYSPINST
jgi:hypothetical protein